MTKCGKGCMPECEYFTTGGCISPFNCPYKIEENYQNKDGKIYYVISRKERRIVTHYICTELTPEAAETRLKELQGGEE